MFKVYVLLFIIQFSESFMLKNEVRYLIYN